MMIRRRRRMPPPGRCKWDHQPGIITWQVHHHQHHHHLAGAGEEESLLNRRSSLLLQSGEVVQAVAVCHLYILIDCGLLTLVGIFRSMFIQILWRWSACLSPPPRAWWCAWRPCRRPCPCWSSTCSGSTSGWTRPWSWVSPRLCWDVLCLVPLWWDLSKGSHHVWIEGRSNINNRQLFPSLDHPLRLIDTCATPF